MWKISGSLCKFIVCSRGKNRQLVWSELFLALKYLRELAECCLKGLWGGERQTITGLRTTALWWHEHCCGWASCGKRPMMEPVMTTMKPTRANTLTSWEASLLFQTPWSGKDWLIDFFSLLFSFLISLKVLTMSMVIFYDVYNNM